MNFLVKCCSGEVEGAGGQCSYQRHSQFLIFPRLVVVLRHWNTIWITFFFKSVSSTNMKKLNQ